MTLINRIQEFDASAPAFKPSPESIGQAAPIQNDLHIDLKIGKAKLKISGLETRPGILFDIFEYLGLTGSKSTPTTASAQRMTASAIDADHPNTQPKNLNITGVIVNEMNDGFDTSLLFEESEDQKIDDLKAKLDAIPNELPLKPDIDSSIEASKYNRTAHITLPIENDGPGILYAFLKIIASPMNPAHRGNITMLRSQSYGGGIALIEADIQLPPAASIDMIRKELREECPNWIPEIIEEPMPTFRL